MDMSQSGGDQFELPATRSPLQGLRVLFAEDCAEQGRLYLMFLQLAGAQVTLECNGQSAVDAAKTDLKHFDAVVMDFQMPEMDGLDATRQLRGLGYLGAILAVTAFGSEDLKRSWFQAGCDDYLMKPLKKRELIHAVYRQTIAKTLAQR
jgi:CheY-like chemotaxis protein